MIVAIIPARKNSKRILGKNISKFFGKPMIERSIILAKKTKIFDKICITTDDIKVKKISKANNVDFIIHRPKNLSGDKVSTISVIKHALKILEKKIKKITYVCCIYPCTPLLQAKNVIKGFQLLKKSKSLFVYPVLKYSHPIQRAIYMNKNNTAKFIYPSNTKIDTKKFKKTFHDAGQFYFASKKKWTSSKNLHLNAKVFEISPWNAIDIDNIEDLIFAKIIYKGLKKK